MLNKPVKKVCNFINSSVNFNILYIYIYIYIYSNTVYVAQLASDTQAVGRGFKLIKYVFKYYLDVILNLYE